MDEIREFIWDVWLFVTSIIGAVTIGNLMPTLPGIILIGVLLFAAPGLFGDRY